MNWSIQTEHQSNGYETLRKKIQKQGGQCAKCPAVNNITVDHIIPRHFLEILGFNDSYKDADNLQLLCKKCNTMKGNSLDYTNPKTLPLLKHYTNLWIEKHGALYIELNTRKITARCLCHVDEKV